MPGTQISIPQVQRRFRSRRDFLRRGFTSRFLKPDLASLTQSVEAGLLSALLVTYAG